MAYGSQQINTDKKPHKRWLLFQEYVYHNGIKINFEHIKGVKMLLLIFSLVLQVYNKMKLCKVSYQNIKQKMKFDNQELSVLTNEFHYPGK